MAGKPKFDPNAPFQAADSSAKPKFDPGAPFQAANGPSDEIPALPGSPEDIAQRAKSRAQPFTDAAEGPLDEVKRVVGSVVGPALKGAGATAETLLSGATGGLSSLKNLAIAATGTKGLFKNPGESDADFYRRSRAETTYTPRSEGGQEAAEGLGKGPMQLLNVAPGVKALTGSDTAGELANDVVAGGLTLAGARGATPKAAAVELPKKLGAMDQNPVAAARAFGDKVRPSDVARAEPETSVKTTSAAEGFAGSKQLRQSLIEHNQKNATAKGLEEIGLPKTEPRVTTKLLTEASAAPLAKYREVGRAVNEFQPTEEFHSDLNSVANQEGLHPDTRVDIAKAVDEYKDRAMSGPDTMKSVSVLRRAAARAAKSDDPAMQDFGFAQRQIANAIESQMERQLTATGNEKLVTEFRDARQQLAKVHDVETATKGGQIDRHILKKLQDKGAPLSGNLAILADSAEMFPHVTKHPQSIADVGGSGSALPGALLDIGSGLTRPAIRKFLSSDFYQNQLGQPAENLKAQLGEYFPKPPEGPKPMPSAPPELPKTSASSMLEAQKRAGDLSLADEVLNPQQLPPVPDRLHAETPPTSRGGLPFKASMPSAVDLAGELGLAPDVAPGSIPGGQAPRAAGRAGDLELMENTHVNAGPLNRVGGNRLSNEGVDLDTESPHGSFAHTRGGVNFRDTGALGQYFTPSQMREAGKYRTNDYTLAEEGAPFPPSLGREPPPTPSAPADVPASGAGLDLAKDLGIEIVPSIKRKGMFELHVNGQPGGAAFTSRGEARTAALDLADQLVGPAERSSPAPARATKGVQGNGALPIGAFDELFKNPQLETLRGVQDQPIPDEFVMPNSTVIRVGEAKSPSGFLALAPDETGGLRISRSTLKPEAQGKGLGKEMLLKAVDEAETVQKPLSSDTSVTVAQLRVYESLKKAGKIDFEYADPTKVAEALKGGNPKTTVKGGGEPVVRNIRRVSGTR